MERLYNCFTRTWWRENPEWPNGLEPHAGRKYTMREGLTYTQAQEFCQEYNRAHKPGRLSRKAEFEER